MKRKLMHGLEILILLAGVLFLTALSGCTLNDYFGRRTVSGPEYLDENEIRKCLAGVRPHENSEQYYRRGRNLQKQNRHLKAIREFQTVVGLKPGHVEALNAMGVSLDSLGRYPDAAKVFQKALDIAPERADILNNLGWSCLLGKDAAAAVGCFQKAAALDTKNRLYWNNLGLAHAEQGDFDAALDAFMKTGDEAGAHSRLAGILEKNGFERQARDHRRLAAALKESPPAIKPPTAIGAPAQAPMPEQAAPPVADQSIPATEENSVASNPPSNEIIEENVAAGPTTFEFLWETKPLPGVSVIDGTTGASPPVLEILGISEIEPPGITIPPAPQPVRSPEVKTEPAEPVAPPNVNTPPIPASKSIAAVTVPEPADASAAVSAPIVGIEISGPNKLRALIRRMEKKLARPGFQIERVACANAACSGITMIYYCDGFLYEAWDVAKTIPGWQNMKKVKNFEKPEIKVRATLGRELVR